MHETIRAAPGMDMCTKLWEGPDSARVRRLASLLTFREDEPWRVCVTCWPEDCAPCCDTMTARNWPCWLGVCGGERFWR